jgi:hypothetical protein
LRRTETDFLLRFRIAVRNKPRFALIRSNKSRRSRRCFQNFRPPPQINPQVTCSFVKSR